MDEEQKKSKAHRAGRAGRGHDKKVNKPKFSFNETNDDAVVPEKTKSKFRLDPNDEAGKEEAKKRNRKVT